MESFRNPILFGNPKMFIPSTTRVDGDHPFFSGKKKRSDADDEKRPFSGRNVHQSTSVSEETAFG